MLTAVPDIQCGMRCVSLHQVIAQLTGRPLVRVNEELAAHTAVQVQGQHEQSDLLFVSLLRLLPAPGAGG